MYTYTCIVTKKLAHLGWQCSYKYHWLSFKDISTRHKKPPFNMLVRKVQETLTSIEAAKGKFLLHKKPHTLDTGLRRFNLDLNSKFPSWRQASIVPLGMKAAKGGRQWIVLPTCSIYYEPWGQPAQSKNHKGAMVTQILVVTNRSLMGLKTHSTGGNSCLVLES